MKIKFYFNHGLPTLNSKGEVDGGLSQKKKKRVWRLGWALCGLGRERGPQKNYSSSRSIRLEEGKVGGTNFVYSLFPNLPSSLKTKKGGRKEATRKGREVATINVYLSIY